MDATDTPPDPSTWPPMTVAWCVVCHRFIKYGTPIQKVGLGRFAHQGPCLVIQGGKK